MHYLLLFEVDDVIPFCLYLMNEMQRNLIKICHVIFCGLTVLTGLAHDVIVYLNLVLLSPVIKIH